MITSFPSLYPDELLYSLFARYHAQSGHIAYVFAAEDLFERRATKPDIEFVDRLTPDALQLITRDMPIETVIEKHTMFPYYARFLPRDRRRQAMALLAQMDQRYHNLLYLIKRKTIMRYLRYCPLCAMEDRKQYGETYINEESEHAFETVVETVYENITADTHDAYSVTTVLCTMGTNENICGHISSQEKVLIEAEAAHDYENGVCACGECNAVWAFEMDGTINLNVQVTSGQPDSSKRYLLIAEDSEGFHYFEYIEAGSSSASFAVVGDLGLKRAQSYVLYVIPEDVELTDENRNKYSLGELTVPLFSGKMVTQVYSGESDVEEKGIVYVGEKISFHWDGSYGVNHTQILVELNGTEVYQRTYGHSGPGVETIDSNEIGAVAGDTLDITITVDPSAMATADGADVLAASAVTIAPVSYTWTAQYADRPIAGYKIKMDWKDMDQVDVTNQYVHVTTAGGESSYFGLRAYSTDDEGNEHLINLTDPDNCQYEWRYAPYDAELSSDGTKLVGLSYDLTIDPATDYFKGITWALETGVRDGYTFRFNDTLRKCIETLGHCGVAAPQWPPSLSLVSPYQKPTCSHFLYSFDMKRYFCHTDPEQQRDIAFLAVWGCR